MRQDELERKVSELERRTSAIERDNLSVGSWLIALGAVPGCLVEIWFVLLLLSAWLGK